MRHLLFAVATARYILLAFFFKEHNLVASLDEPYRAYRQRQRYPNAAPAPKRATKCL